MAQQAVPWYEQDPVYIAQRHLVALDSDEANTVIYDDDQLELRLDLLPNLRTRDFLHRFEAALRTIPPGTALKQVNIMSLLPDPSNLAVQILQAFSSTNVMILFLAFKSPSIELADVMRRCVACIPKKTLMVSPLSWSQEALAALCEGIEENPYLEKLFVVRCTEEDVVLLLDRFPSFKSIRCLSVSNSSDAFVSPSDAMLKGLRQSTTLLQFYAPDMRRTTANQPYWDEIDNILARNHLLSIIPSSGPMDASVLGRYLTKMMAGYNHGLRVTPMYQMLREFFPPIAETLMSDEEPPRKRHRTE